MNANELLSLFNTMEHEEQTAFLTLLASSQETGKVLSNPTDATPPYPPTTAGFALIADTLQRPTERHGAADSVSTAAIAASPFPRQQAQSSSTH